MSDTCSDSDLLVQLGEELVARHRRGERPSPAEYAARYPDLAQDIHDLFPTMLMVEEGGRPPGPTQPVLASLSSMGSPSRLGEFRLVREVGRGGTGVVYEAVQESLGRQVALKVLFQQRVTDPSQLERFKREARAAAKLHHTNIVPVFGVGEQDGVYFYAMEFIEGRSLDAVLRQKKQQRAPEGSATSHVNDYAEVARLGVQAAEALAYAHQQGMLHRDIKPGNLMVDDQGTVWVTDFGLVKEEDGEGLTATGDIVGTLRYLAPERFQGRADPRSDIYSLGLTLYEMLTLQPAHPATERAQLVEQVMGRGPPPPRLLDRHIPRDLETIVLKAMAREPAERYSTAAALAEDLQRFLTDRPILARRTSAWERARRWVRRNRVVTALAGSIVLLLLGGAIGGGVLSWNLWTALEETRQAEQEKDEKLRLSYFERARAGRFSRQMGQRFDSLAALAEAARIRPDEQLRDEAIAAMALPDLRRGPTWTGISGNTWSWIFDSLYRFRARGNQQGVITIHSVPEDREVQRIVSEPLATKFSLGLSPDGRHVARWQEGGRLRVWRVADAQPVLQVEPLHTLTCSFSPDGKQLVVGQATSILRFNLASGREVNRWRLPENALPCNLAFNPDNRWVAVGYRSSTVVSVYEATSGQLLAELPVGPTREQVIAWHPDGERLAVAGSERIQLWHVPGKRRLAILEGHVQQVTILSFHPDGSLLGSGSWDGVMRLWDPATGRPLMQLPALVVPAFSSDGRWLGVARQGEQAQLLEVVPSREYRTFANVLGPDSRENYDGDISPDGRLLALDMGSGGIHLWHLASGRELAVLPAGVPLFQPDGRELITCGQQGVRRWPIQADAAGNELRLGAPRTIPLPLVPTRAVRSRDGRTLAVVGERQGLGLLVDPTAPSVTMPPLDHPSAAYVALSPDGQWMATSGWHSDRVRLWNARTRKMVHEWNEGQARVFFTPDSRTLILGRSDEFSFWDVNTLQPTRPLRRDVALYPGQVAFSPDGRLMALEMAPAVVHLKEVATGRTVARLEDPHGDRAGWMGFSPDGTQLVVVAHYAHAIHVWDLRAIRQRLKQMDLDWDWDEFPPPRPGPDTVPTVLVAGGDRLNDRTDWHKQATIIADVQHWEKSLDTISRALHLDPDSAAFWESRGVACGRLGRWDEALAHHTKAIKLGPTRWQAWCNHGFALAQTGQWEEARADLEKATRLPGALALPWSHLGVLRLQRGDQAGFRKDCAAMLKMLDRSLDQEDTYWIGWTCVLLPDAVADWQPLLRRAQESVRAATATGDSLHVLGCVLYRTGQFEEAARRLADAEEAIKANQAARADVLCTRLFRAMTLHRLGRAEEAKRLLETVVKDIDPPPPSRTWNHRQALQLLHREARDLVQPGSGGSPRK